MSSRYDELERLQRLRESGALADEEFQAEKRRLLGYDAPEPAPPPAREEIVEVDEDRSRRRAVWIIAGVGGMIVAILAGLWLGRQVGTGGNSGAEINVAMPEENVASADEPLIAPPPPPDVRTLPAAEQLGRAFAAAFGTSGQATLEVGGRSLVYRPGRLIWLGGRGILISPALATEDCHACAGTLAVHYLTPVGDKFQVTGAWPDAVSGSGWGAPPRWRLRGDLTAFPAIWEEGGYTGQGCTMGGATLTELRPGGPVQSGPIRLFYSNMGALSNGDEDGTDVTGKLANVKKDVPFDVVYSGAQSFTETWAKQGEKFQLQGGETRMPAC